MKPRTFMLIAGEASGDLLAADLVRALRKEFAQAESRPSADLQPLHATLEPRFFGAGGPCMAEAGVELAFDLTAHSVIGIPALKAYFELRRLFRQLFRLALDREPDAIICVDFGGFNRRFAHAIKQYVRSRRDWFHDWHPKLIQYVSPQVWASRPGRAYQLASDYDLLLTLFPFEKEWYAKRVPKLRVEFVGHPIWDRSPAPAPRLATALGPAPLLLLLPGSRTSELARHLPVMTEALAILRRQMPQLRARVVFPNEKLLAQANALKLPDHIEVQVGGLHQALSEAGVAIASTGTVTVECAGFGVPTVALYKTSWFTYQVGKRIVTVKFLAMPNLLANEEIFPEFIQGTVTAENVARAALDLLQNESRRQRIKSKLAEIVATLGGPGSSRRSAKAILSLLTINEHNTQPVRDTPDRDHR